MAASAAVHAFAVPVRRVAIALGLLTALATFAQVASAARTVVAQDGSGEFTRIQTAIDSMYARRTPTSPPDTVVVMPGFYDETIAAYDGESLVLVIECPGGPELTGVRSVHFPGFVQRYGVGPARIVGLRVAETVVTSIYPALYTFVACRFEAGYRMPLERAYEIEYGEKILQDCVFLDSTRLVLPAFGGGPDGGLEGLRFAGTHLVAKSTAVGSGRLTRCTFEGPGELLVTADPWRTLNVHFDQCVFRGGVVGVAKAPTSGYDNYESRVRFEDCVFEDFTGSAIAGYVGANAPRPAGFSTYRCRFTRCVRAVEWGVGSGDVVMQSDTIQAGGYPAVRLNAARVELDNLRFEPGAGGVHVRLESWVIRPDIGEESPGWLWVRDCSWDAPNGPALDLSDTVVTNRAYSFDITRNTILNASGSGIVVRAPRALIRGNTVIGCDGTGIAITPLEPIEGFVVDSNTVARNAGDGIGFTEPWYTGERVFRHNLVARNDGAGLRVGTPFAGSVAFNDAWQNALGDYAQVDSPLDSNLVANPRFCDLAGGDLRLQYGSPCGASGPYGQIGSLPEACPSSAGAESSAMQALAFSINPNPARGEVAFTLGPGPAGLLEILDVHGRRVWQQAFAAGSPSLRWRGESHAARVVAGLYWARILRGQAAHVRRLVWLR